MSHDPPHHPPTGRPVVVARPVRRRSGPPIALPLLPRADAAVGLGVAVLGLFVMIGLGLATQVGFLWFSGTEAHGAELHWLIVVDKWLAALLTAGLALGLLKLHQLRPAAFGLSRRHFDRQLGWSAVALVGVFIAHFAGVVVIVLLLQLFPQFNEDLASRREFLEMMPLDDLLLTVLLLVPVAIQEELLFRGLLIPYLYRLGCGWVGAIVISTVIFASLHASQGLLAIPQIFAVGATFGLFFVLSRSLTTVIIAHFFFNLIQFRLAGALKDFIQDPNQLAALW